MGSPLWLWVNTQPEKCKGEEVCRRHRSQRAGVKHLGQQGAPCLRLLLRVCPLPSSPLTQCSKASKFDCSWCLQYFRQRNNCMDNRLDNVQWTCKKWSLVAIWRHVECRSASLEWCGGEHILKGFSKAAEPFVKQVEEESSQNKEISSKSLSLLLVKVQSASAQI